MIRKLVLAMTILGARGCASAGLGSVGQWA
jgi:hypothetical protein